MKTADVQRSFLVLHVVLQIVCDQNAFINLSLWKKKKLMIHIRSLN